MGTIKIYAVWMCIMILSPAVSMAADPDVSERLEKEKAIYERQIQSLQIPYAGTISEPTVRPDEEKTEGPKFWIKQITIQNLPSASFCGLEQMAAKWKNQWMDLDHIRELSNRLTEKLKSEGYATSYISVPSQNIKEGTVNLRFHPGRIHSFRLAEGSDKGYYKNAFPTGTGKILNIRDLEQGLEQIRRVQGQDIQMKIIPISEEESDIELYFTRGRSWGMSASFNNHGDSATGKRRLQLQGNWDNLIGFNDTFSVGMGRQLGNKEDYQRYKSFFATYTIPYGNYLFTWQYSASDTTQPLDFWTIQFPYASRTRSSEWRMEKTVARNQNSRWRVQAALSKYKRNNFIADTELKVQRMNKTNFTLGVSQDRYFSKGQMNLSVSISKGVPWPGAQPELPGNLRLRSFIWNVDLAYIHWFKVFQKPLLYRMLLHGQQASNELYSIDEISIGSPYTVRGFTGEQSLSGKSGWYMQNEWTLYDGTWKPYIGWDIGAIYGMSRMASCHILSGITMGIRKGGGPVFGSLSVSVPIYRPTEWKGNSVVIFFETGIRF